MDEEAEVTVKLTPSELLERSETLAGKVLHIEALRKKKDDGKNTQTLIDAELDEVARLARVITGQEELRKQGELTFGETEAAGALTKVGKAAEKKGDKVTPFPKRAKKKAAGAKKKGSTRPTAPGGAA